MVVGANGLETTTSRSNMFSYAVNNTCCYVGLRNKKATGFTGYVTYELKDKETSGTNPLSCWHDYAEYANIGGNKTAAYGTVRFTI